MGYKKISGRFEKISFLFILIFILSGCNVETPNELVQKAKLLRTQNHIEVAIIELKNILQQYPDTEPALLELSEIYLEKRQYDDVVNLLLTPIKKGISNQETLYSLTDSLIHLAKFKQALAIINDHSDQFQSAQGLALTGHCYAGLNETKKCMEYYKKSLLLDENLASSHLGLAQEGIIFAEKNGLVRVQNKNQHVETNDWVTVSKNSSNNNNDPLEVSKEHLLKVLKLEPENIVANYLFATIYYFEKDVFKAQESINKVFEVEPNHKESLLLMAKLHMELAHLDKSEQFLKQYINIVPEDLKARMYLASIMLRKNQPDLALEILKDHPEDWNSNTEYLLIMGNAYLSKGDNNSSVEYFEKALILFPNSVLVKMYAAMGYLGRSDTLKNDRNSAIKLLEEVLEVDPENDKAGISLITTLLQETEYLRAINVAENMINNFPKAPMPWYLSGIAWQSLENLDNAIIALLKTLELRHPFIPATIRLAKIYQEKDQYKLAQKQLEMALYDSPYNSEVMTEMALLEQSLGNNKKAVEILELARDRNPKSLSPRLLLGTYYLRRGQINSAQSLLQELNKIAPERPDVQMYFGEIKLATKRSAEAVEIFSKLILIKPDSPEILSKYGAALRLNGQIDESKKALKSALGLSNKNNTDALFELGKIELSDKNYQEVRGISNDLQLRFPDLSIGYLLEGDSFIQQGKSKDAIIPYSTALQKNLTTSTILKLYDAYSRSGMDQKAYALLDDAAKKQPDDLRLGMTLASVKHNSGDSIAAINVYENLLIKNPENALILNNLAWVYNKTNLKKALSLAKRAYQVTPELPQIIDSYGWFSVLEGQLKQGQDLLESAVKKSPADPEFRYHLAEAFLRLGEKKSAREALEIALASQKDFTGRNDAEELFMQLSREEVNSTNKF